MTSAATSSDPGGKRVVGRKKTPASFHTHKIVTCNTNYPESVCRQHKDGTQHDHRIPRTTVESMRSWLGK